MCRLAAYTGPPVSLSALLYDAPHGLEVQAYKPQEMVSGHVNVDGTGLAWWHHGESEPLRYVTEHPPWSDANLTHLARRLRGSPVMAVVRSQTPGMPAGAAAVHPFVYRGWAGAHNGYLEGFAGYAAELVHLLDPDLVGEMEVLSDARVLFLLAMGAVRRGATMQEALVEVAARAVAICDAHGVVASINLALADGQRVVALRAARGAPANSLYYAAGAEQWPGGALMASEPLDGDAAWRPVEEGHVVTLRGGDAVVEAVAL